MVAQDRRKKCGPGTWLLLTTLLALVVFTAVSMGPAGISVGDVFMMVARKLSLLETGSPSPWPPAHEIIVFQIRLPRVLLAGLIGAGLATSGAAFQALFRNPMADPYVIGVSAGASLGAAIGIIVRKSVGWFGISGVTLFAFVGAVAAALVVYQLSQRGGRVSVASLLLAGVALGAFLTAVVSLLMVLSTNDLQKIALWMMGSLSGRGWENVWAAFPFMVIGTVVCLVFARDLNVLLLGEEVAGQLGVEVEKLKLMMIAVGSIMAGAAVANSGVIGFVGLITPHAVRLLVGPDHRVLLPTTALVGAMFLILADSLARNLFGGVELPVGVITALCGAPFFLYLLRRARLGSV